MCATQFLLAVVLSFCFVSAAQALTISGPINANLVAVSGDVTVSSITVSSLTVTGVLNYGGQYNETGLVLQMKFSSSTAITTTTNSSWTALPDFAQEIALSNSTNHVKITLSGGLYEHSVDTGPVVSYGYITIFRDSTNLGHADYGFTCAQSRYIETADPFHFPGTSSAGINVIDSPGDTAPHMYKVYIYTDRTTNYVAFPKGGAGFLVLEEISGL